MIDGVPATSISISSLATEGSFQSTSTPLNQSALNKFNTQVNIQANIRDYLMPFTMNLLISTPDSIKLQASTLSQLTQATNQLTRTAAVRINSILPLFELFEFKLVISIESMLSISCCFKVNDVFYTI